MKKLCIYGCGGTGREIADLARRKKIWDDIIFVDDHIVHPLVDGHRVFEFDAMLNSDELHMFEFIVSTGEPESRRMLYEKLAHHELTLASMASESCLISELSSVGAGTIMLPGVTLTVNVRIAEGCLIIQQSAIGHDASIGRYSVVAQKVAIGGEVDIGECCYLGSGAVIRNGISIGDYAIVGMGAVVLKDVPPGHVVVGNPARLLRINEERRVF